MSRGLLVISFVALSVLSSAQKNLDKLEDQAYNAYSKNDTTALLYANEFLEEARKQDTKYKINAYTLLGILYKDKGMYVTALEHYLLAYETARNLKDMPRTSVCLNNVGSVYQLQGNYERAKSYFKESLNIEDSLNVPEQKSIRYYNLAEIYKEQDSTDLALSNYNNSLQIEESLQNGDGIAYALIGIAEIYLKLGRITDAEITIEKVTAQLSNLSADVRILALLNKGKLLTKKSDYNAALQYFDQALSVADKYEIYIHHQTILDQKIRALKYLKNYPELVTTYDAYLAVLQKQNSAAIKNQLNDLTYQNELNRQELEIKLLADERDMAKRNAESISQINRLTRNIIIFLVLTFGIVGFSIFYLYKQLFRK